MRYIKNMAVVWLTTIAFFFIVSCRDTWIKRGILVRNVQIIPMDGSDTILTGKAIHILDGIIHRIGDLSDLDGQYDSTIEGEGRFLLPGLIDAHVHIKDKNDLNMYLVNGITTVRNMRGEPRTRKWMQKIDEGKLLGPKILSSGQTILNQGGKLFEQVLSPEEARAVVKKQRDQGYTLLKVLRLDKPSFEALMDEAGKNNMKVSGHIPMFDVPLSYLANSGMQSFEHLHFFYISEVERMPKEKRIPFIVNTLRGKNIFIVPTLFNTYNINRVGAVKEKFITDSLERLLGYFTHIRDAYSHIRDVNDEEKKNGKITSEDIDALLQLLKTMHEAGIKIAAGTDSGGHLAIPGFTFYHELAFYAKAGLSNYEILKTATNHAAELLGINKSFGTIEEGRKAHFILVDKNPLRNLETIKKPQGIMVNGHWLNKQALALLRETL